MALAAGTEFAYILHPTDFAEASAPAFHHALRLAVAARAHFNMLHIASAAAGEIGDWSAFPGVRATLAEWGMLPKDAAPAAVYQQLGVRVTKAELPHREPVDGILRYLGDNPSDFLVLAPDLGGGPTQRSKQSVSFPLARKSGLPCLFVPAGTPGFVAARTGVASLRHLLLAAEAGVEGRRASAMARRLADGLGCADVRLHVVHPAGSEAPAVAEAWSEDRVARIEVPDLSPGVIGRQAAELTADLVVLASREHTGVFDQFRGDGTEELLRAVRRPLLNVPTA